VSRELSGAPTVIIPNFTPDDLKKLPLRAIVALAARCARRVEQLTTLPGDHPQHEQCRMAVANAIKLAEHFASGSPCSGLEDAVREIEACRAAAEGDYERSCAMGAAVMAVHAAATAMHALALRAEPHQAHYVPFAEPDPFPHLADVTADLAAQEAFLAGMEAAGGKEYADSFVRAGAEDYAKLLELELGSYPQAGNAIDPSPRGPLGPLERSR
jgi:hypothetical protein